MVESSEAYISALRELYEVDSQRDGIRHELQDLLGAMHRGGGREPPQPVATAWLDQALNWLNHSAELNQRIAMLASQASEDALSQIRGLSAEAERARGSAQWSPVMMSADRALASSAHVSNAFDSYGSPYQGTMTPSTPAYAERGRTATPSDVGLLMSEGAAPAQSTELWQNPMTRPQGGGEDLEPMFWQYMDDSGSTWTQPQQQPQQQQQQQLARASQQGPPGQQRAPMLAGQRSPAGPPTAKLSRALTKLEDFQDSLLTVCMVRHGESINNILSQSYNPVRYFSDAGSVMFNKLYPTQPIVSRDPPLSSLAERQALKLTRQLFPDGTDPFDILADNPCSSGPPPGKQFQMVLVSPLRRCIATALLLLGKVSANKRVPWMAAPWAHEHYKTESDRGESPEELRLFLKRYCKRVAKIPLDSVPVMTLMASLGHLPKKWSTLKVELTEPLDKKPYMQVRPGGPYLNYYAKTGWEMKGGSESHDHMVARMQTLMRWMFEEVRMPAGCPRTPQEAANVMGQLRGARPRRVFLIAHAGVLRECFGLQDRPDNFSFRQGVLSYKPGMDEFPQWEYQDWFWSDDRFKDANFKKMPESKAMEKRLKKEGKQAAKEQMHNSRSGKFSVQEE